jgi:hypothetical protein
VHPTTACHTHSHTHLPVLCLFSVHHPIQCPVQTPSIDHVADTPLTQGSPRPPLSSITMHPSWAPCLSTTTSPPFVLAFTPNRVVSVLRGIPYHALLERMRSHSHTHTLARSAVSVLVVCRFRTHHQPLHTIGLSDAFAFKTEMTTQVMPCRRDNLRDPQQQLNHRLAYARRIPKNCCIPADRHAACASARMPVVCNVARARCEHGTKRTLGPVHDSDNSHPGYYQPQS